MTWTLNYHPAEHERALDRLADDVERYIDAEQARAELRHNSDRRDDERDPDAEYDAARDAISHEDWQRGERP